ncbi:MAG: hypothetical protein FGM34_07490 [Solirubrobacteraceae bacterium]|nr:hypothetical protein [Solirubrobacteraceae bacterium]
MTETLPPNTGFVAAAYVVFVALLLIYVTIMAIRASRLERELDRLLSEEDPRESTTVVEETVVEEAIR